MGNEAVFYVLKLLIDAVEQMAFLLRRQQFPRLNSGHGHRYFE
jgi:hypothetical protein